MKIHLMSDVHLEFGDIHDYTPPPCDLVILAGDISDSLWSVEWAKITFPNTLVLIVCGNHEFYNGIPVAEHLAALKAAAAGSNVTVLENDAVIIDGIRFLGATLWTNFDLYNNPFYHRLDAERGLNDYRYIKTAPGVRLTGIDTLQFHGETVEFFTQQFEADPDIPTVIITHHAPSELSCQKEYKGHHLTPAFASRMEGFMLKHNPVLWVHGHMHNTSDYVIGDTRIVANPRGYVGHALNKTFDPTLVIEI